MTTLDAFNKFFQSDLEVSHTSDELALYMRLLHRANQLRKGRFNLAVDKLMMELGMKTKRPFDTARKGLRDAGLIEFQNGNGRGCTTEYLLIGLDFQSEQPPERGAKNTPLSAPLSDTLSATIPHRKREENALLHKSKIKSKNKEANASTAAGKNSSSQPAENPTPALEPWAAWLAENAPRVQQLKTPLTAKQWASLVADFGEPMVQEVFSAMENNADLLKKYTSASLTARDWCKRRCRNGVPKPAPPPASPVEAPEMNPEFLAQQAAQASADRAALLARRTTPA